MITTQHNAMLISGAKFFDALSVSTPIRLLLKKIGRNYQVFWLRPFGEGIEVWSTLSQHSLRSIRNDLANDEFTFTQWRDKYAGRQLDLAWDELFA